MQPSGQMGGVTRAQRGTAPIFNGAAGKYAVRAEVRRAGRAMDVKRKQGLHLVGTAASDFCTARILKPPARIEDAWRLRPCTRSHTRALRVVRLLLIAVPWRA